MNALQVSWVATFDWKWHYCATQQILTFANNSTYLVCCDLKLTHLENVLEDGSVCGIHAQVSYKKIAMEKCRLHECWIYQGEVVLFMVVPWNNKIVQMEERTIFSNHSSFQNIFDITSCWRSSKSLKTKMKTTFDLYFIWAI